MSAYAHRPVDAGFAAWKRRGDALGQSGLIALVVVLVAIALYALLRLELRPDFGLYVGHGFGVYPSPLGRAIGAAGAWPLVVVNAAGAGYVALVLARARVSVWVILTGAPLLLFLLVGGVDGIGAALAVASYRARSDARAGLGAFLCGLIHPGSAIVPGLELLRRRPLLIGPLLALALGLLTATQYGALTVPRLTIAGLIVGAVVALWAVLPAGIWPSRWQLLLLLVVALAVALVRGTDHGDSIAYLRYGLPLMLRLAL